MKGLIKLAVVAGAVYGFVQYVNKEGNEELKKKVNTTIDDAKKACVSASKIVVEALKENEDVKKVFDKGGEVVNTVKEKADEYKVEEKFNTIKEKGQEIYNTTKDNVVNSDLYNSAMNKGTEIYSNVKETILSSDTYNEVKEKGTGILADIKEKASSFFAKGVDGSYKLSSITANGKEFKSDEFNLLDIKEAVLDLDKNNIGTIKFVSLEDKETIQDVAINDEDGLKISVNGGEFIDINFDGKSIEFTNKGMTFKYSK